MLEGKHHHHNQWEANPQYMSEIVQAFRQANSSDNNVQLHVTNVLQKLNELPDAMCYLATILCTLNEEREDVRQVAGLALKNHLRLDNIYVTENILGYIKPLLLHCLEDSNKAVRQTAGIVVTTLICMKGGNYWPEALHVLIQALDNQQDDSIVDGAFNALCKICEDELLMYNDRTAQATFINFCHHHLLPKLFLLCGPQTKPFCRKYAVSCLLFFVQAQSFSPGGVFNQFFPQYWNTLGSLATDSDADIRKAVVQGMILVVEFFPDAIFTSADAVFSFMVNCCNDPEYAVRLEALEFWPAVLKDSPYQPQPYRSKTIEIIRNYFHKLLPVLLENTIYTEWDYLGMDSSPLEEDNSNVPDDAQDLKPRFHHHKNNTNNTIHNNNSGGVTDDNVDDDDDYENDSKGTWGGGWTVRKGAALALDNLSTTYMEEILPDVLPLVEKRLADSSWEIRESAVLTLGAIAPGCMRGLSPYLPKVLDFLLKLCDDPKPLLRSISCWCISRFSSWICHETNESIWVKPVLAQVLKHVLDKNKRVQEAACSAFATLEEEARYLLQPFLTDIIHTVRQAFRFYQAKNLLILYDAVGTLAETVGEGLQKGEFVKDLMEPLLNKLFEMKSHDPLCIALFECITCCTAALKESFAPYAETVIKKCGYIIESTLNEIKRYESGQINERPTSDLMECSLDLLSGVTGGLGETMAVLLAQKQGNDNNTNDMHPNMIDILNNNSNGIDMLNNTSINFIPLVQRCCIESTAPTVLQSSFALVGDLAKHCIVFLKPHLPIIIPKLAEYLMHEATSVSNNAGWALGEISMRAGCECIEPYVDTIAMQLVKSMNRRELHRSLLQNVCITLGRLGLVCPKKMAVYAPQFLKSWCCIMGHAHNDVEKVHAFQGICIIIGENPAAASDSLLELIAAILSCHPVNEDIHAQFQLLIFGLRQKFPQQWEEMWVVAPPPLKNDFLNRFKLE